MTPDDYARDLLRELGCGTTAPPVTDTREEAELWADSGAQCLTGHADGPPLAAPAALATCARGAWLALTALGAGALDADFPAHRLLGERAALLGLRRQGAVSAGGACRLLDCADGQLALNLPRADDWQLLPAWLEDTAESWADIAQCLRQRSCASMVARARLLGLAAAASLPPELQGRWFASHALAAPAQQPRRQPLVVDLTALWAGPLCTHLLGLLGARVIKVESTTRPDGARAGPPAFFDLLNAGKENVALDVASARGREQLGALLARADIVVEATRPRALEQLGINAADLVRAGAGKVWLSITGYGREAPMREWIAYGDDAGVAAGLSWLLRQAGAGNVFCADAIADPLSGLHAALLGWAAWTRGGGELLDVSLRGVVSRCIAAGQVAPKTWSVPGPPCARTGSGAAAALGSDTARVLSEFGIRT